jgi:hypothetical protein
MLHQPILAPWARLFVSLALEVILVFALTALLARLVRSASGQRPAGNAVHTDADLHERTNSVPSQLPPPLK